MPSSGTAPVPIRPFSDWKNTCIPAGTIVGDQGRNADAEIDEHAGAQLLRDALGDDRLRHPWRSPVRDEIVDKRCRRHDMVGRDHADRHDVVGAAR